jgi:hypothetical protein
MSVPAIPAFAAPLTLACGAAPPARAAACSQVAPPVCLNRRSEAARRRWQDPQYRAKMQAARARNLVRLSEHTVLRGGASTAEEDIEVADVSGQEGVIEIGVGDSITHCDDAKAAVINSYVMRNKHRSEKLIMFHNDKQRWMDDKLQQGKPLRMLINSEDFKRQRQMLRQQEARARHARIRARKQAEEAAGRNRQVRTGVMELYSA